MRSVRERDLGRRVVLPNSSGGEANNVVQPVLRISIFQYSASEGQRRGPGLGEVRTPDPFYRGRRESLTEPANIEVRQALSKGTGPTGHNSATSFPGIAH